jgi:2-haloacid dehalogenase
MNPTSIKAIIFDAYGTLLDIRTVDELLRQLFGEKAGRIASLWRQKQLEYTWLRTLMNRYVPFKKVTQDALVYACRVAEVNLHPSQAEALMQAYDRLLVYEEVKKALHRLKADYRLAVLSNANPEMLNNALGHNQITNLLEAIISVDETKYFKPRPEVYQLAEEKLGLPRQEMLFISSNTWDVAGAKSFGLQVAWANRFDGYVEELGFEPDLVIQDLVRLCEKLGC